MIGMLGNLSGLRIVISDYVDEIIRTPIKRHRKRRTQKKWSKRFGYKTVTKPNIMQMNDCLIMSPKSYEILKKSVGERNVKTGFDQNSSNN